MWQMHEIGAGWWLLTSIVMVALWAAVLWGVLKLVRDRRSDAAEEQPDQVLRRRLARGDISPDEYRHLRELLG